MLESYSRNISTFKILLFQKIKTSMMNGWFRDNYYNRLFFKLIKWLQYTSLTLDVQFPFKCFFFCFFILKLQSHDLNCFSINGQYLVLYFLIRLLFHRTNIIIFNGFLDYLLSIRERQVLVKLDIGIEVVGTSVENAFYIGY